ncbi:MAG: endonuclease/exonuclease/phosphatase family protein, partial [Deltaproteobacteria bacterium]|nr:endonuclease/exonuclease/phosphatase family protein [Deltaproteobacteria bacterium]
VSFSVFGLNVGMFGPPLDGAKCFRDETRAKAILPRLQGDVACLSEVWTQKRAEWFAERLAPRGYHHVLCSPFGPGVPRVIEILREKSHDQSFPLYKRRLAAIAASHIEKNPLAAVKKLVAADRSVRGTDATPFFEGIAVNVLEEMLGDELIFGAGLMILSKFPFQETGTLFYDGACQVGIERHSRRALAFVRVEPATGCPVNIMTTHLPEGDSKESKEARKEPLRRIGEKISQFEEPAILIGDLNVVGGSEEYYAMLKLLGMFDPEKKNPHTYLARNFMAKILRLKKGLGVDARLDYALHTRDSRLKALRPVLIDAPLRRGATDHKAILGRYQIRRT